MGPRKDVNDAMSEVCDYGAFTYFARGICRMASARTKPIVADASESSRRAVCTSKRMEFDTIRCQIVSSINY